MRYVILRSWLESQHPRTAISSDFYKLIPKWRSGNTPFIDSPYDPEREEHWIEHSRVETFAKAISSERSELVVDLGSGDGWPSLVLASLKSNIRVLGIESSAQRVQRCIENGTRLHITNTAFVSAQMDKIPLSDCTADTVISSFAVEESATLPDTLDEIFRILKPHGKISFLHQIWDLPDQTVKTFSVLEGIRQGIEHCLILVDTVRQKNPNRETKIVAVVSDTEHTRAICEKILLTLAGYPSIFGEAWIPANPSSLETSIDLEVEILEAHILDCFQYSLVRYADEELVYLLDKAGFTNIQASALPDDQARAAFRRTDGTEKDFYRDCKLIGETQLSGKGFMTAKKPEILQRSR